MPLEEGCNYKFGGEKMKEHWDRVMWNFKHLFDFKTPNPYKLAENGKERIAIKDQQHAIMNLFTEYCRACPYGAGHVWFFQTLATVILIIVAIIVHI